MKKVLWTVAIVIVVMAAVALAAAASGMIEVAADRSHGGVTAWYLALARESAIERAIEGIEVPPLDDAAVAAGAASYRAMCAGCHGAPGTQPGVVGRGLNPRPPDLAEEEWDETHHQTEAFWVVKHGIRMTGMPSFGETHDDEALWDIVAFLGRLPELDAASYQKLAAEASGTAAGHGDHDHEAAEPSGEHHDDEDHHLTAPRP